MTRRPKRKARAAGKTVRKPARKAVRLTTRKSVRSARRASLAGRGDALDAFIAGGAKALGLKIDPAWMPAVRSYLEVTLRHGASVTAFALPDESEPAPVFRA